MTRNTTISEEAARKRQEIGLSARRTTARSVVMRPPTDEELAAQATFRGFGGWWLVFFTSLLALATFLLIAARFLQSETDLTAIDADVAALTDGKLNLLDVGNPLRGLKWQTQKLGIDSAVPSLFDEFTSAKSVLSEGQDASRSMRIDPRRGIYLMRVESGSAAWSLLGAPFLHDYHIETRALVVAAHPQSSAGLVVRFIDADHFYLLAVDGNRQVQVLKADGQGNWQSLLPWMESNNVFPAGEINMLEIEDRGRLLRFFVNAQPIFEYEMTSEEAARTGDAGLWSAAIGDALAEVEFERIQLNPLN